MLTTGGTDENYMGSLYIPLQLSCKSKSYPKIKLLFYCKKVSIDGFLKKILFIFRQREREGEREGENHQCVVAPCSPPHWGPGLQPRHVP